MYFHFLMDTFFLTDDKTKQNHAYSFVPTYTTYSKWWHLLRVYNHTSRNLCFSEFFICFGLLTILDYCFLLPNRVPLDNKNYWELTYHFFQAHIFLHCIYSEDDYWNENVINTASSFRTQNVKYKLFQLPSEVIISTQHLQNFTNIFEFLIHTSICIYPSHFICCFLTLISINRAYVLLCSEELINPSIQMLTHVLFYAVAPKNL